MQSGSVVVEDVDGWSFREALGVCSVLAGTGSGTRC